MPISRSSSRQPWAVTTCSSLAAYGISQWEANRRVNVIVGRESRRERLRRRRYEPVEHAARLDVEEPSTTLAGNRAFGNADLGIEAVAGVIDGGGNRAWDIGNPLQCLNVDCG
jgi:hypothetical protein